MVNEHLPTAHAYADDSQIIFSFRPHSSASQDLAVSAIESCVANVRALLVSHRLMFNDARQNYSLLDLDTSYPKFLLTQLRLATHKLSLQKLGLMV